MADGVEGLSRVVAEEGGDTIYALDRHVEPLVEASIAAWPDDCFPCVLIAEGLGTDGRRDFGDSGRAAAVRLLIDPIDGTRGLMYDKRSAWFIAAAALDHGDNTRLRDVFASVLVELPTSKQTDCDVISAAAGQPTRWRRESIADGTSQEHQPRPSQARELGGGFGHVSSFFQGTRRLAADLMERIADRCVAEHRSARTAIFDDQYISTAGQMVELLTGRDRFCCDLRPLLRQIEMAASGESLPELVCHPYDAGGLLAAEQAGVIITDGFGRELDAPCDVHTPVHWCGYANARIRDLVAPVVSDWLGEHGLSAG